MRNFCHLAILPLTSLLAKKQRKTGTPYFERRDLSTINMCLMVCSLVPEVFLAPRSAKDESRSGDKRKTSGYLGLEPLGPG